MGVEQLRDLCGARCELIVEAEEALMSGAYGWIFRNLFLP